MAFDEARRKKLRWSRVVMNKTCGEWLRELPYLTAHALEIWGHIFQDFGFARSRTVNYPEYDLCAP